jgi:hypothetical protein
VKNFTEEEQVVILEMARIAMGDGFIFDEVAAALDLSDEYLIQLRDKVEANTNGIDIEY